jgi:hypothetical protein
MKKTIIAAALAGVGALGLTACDVQKTQNGQMPEVNVSGGQLPEYNVTGPDVNVGTENKVIQVPTVDVKTGSEKKKEEAGH